MLLGCDAITACSADVLSKLDRNYSHAVINEQTSITSDFIQNRDADSPLDEVRSLIHQTVKRKRAYYLDSVLIANKACQNPIASNMVMLGFAWQQGLIPLTRPSIEQAILLNKVSVEMNTDAFHWGRCLAQNRIGTEQALGKVRAPALTLNEIIAKNSALLSEYHDKALAKRYCQRLNQIRSREKAQLNSHIISRIVAQEYARFLAIKDEFEVARLLTSAQFIAELDANFSPGYCLIYNLAPPSFKRSASKNSKPSKMALGQWLAPLLRRLASARKIRNTWLDPFRFTQERKADLRLLSEYEKLLIHITNTLSPQTHETLIELAESSHQIRGFGHIRAKSIEQGLALWRKAGVN